MTLAKLRAEAEEALARGIAPVPVLNELAAAAYAQGHAAGSNTDLVGRIGEAAHRAAYNEGVRAAFDLVEKVLARRNEGTP